MAIGFQHPVNRTILCINRHREGKVNKVFCIIVVCLFRHSVMLDDTDVCKFRHSVMFDDTDMCKFRYSMMLDDTDMCKFRQSIMLDDIDMCKLMLVV